VNVTPRQARKFLRIEWNIYAKSIQRAITAAEKKKANARIDHALGTLLKHKNKRVIAETLFWLLERQFQPLPRSRRQPK
jgi:hypothetical protein